jgi:hypothetical protein
MDQTINEARERKREREREKIFEVAKKYRSSI